MQKLIAVIYGLDDLPFQTPWTNLQAAILFSDRVYVRVDVRCVKVWRGEIPEQFNCPMLFDHPDQLYGKTKLLTGHLFHLQNSPPCIH